MRLERFGLSFDPFTEGGHAFVAVPSRAEPLVRIERCLCEARGIAVLTAGSGLGKTALCRELVRRLQPQWRTAHLRDAACTTRRSLWQAILFEVGLPYAGLSEQEARLRMLESIRDGRPARPALMLLVDEAHLLNDRLLEELRTLVNYEHQDVSLVRLLLCGSPALEERLAHPALQALNQRIVCHETLPPLSQEESAHFIDQRLVQAGGDGWEHIYTRAAMELICHASDGVPRNLEQLAARSLELAAGDRSPRVAIDHVRSALTQLRELPLQWNEPAQLDRDLFESPNQLAESTGTGAPTWPEFRPEAEREPTMDSNLEPCRGGEFVSVEVGDELPITASPTASFIEFGADHLSPVGADEVGPTPESPQDSVLDFEHDQTPSDVGGSPLSLADTAVLIVGDSVQTQDAASVSRSIPAPVPPQTEKATGRLTDPASIWAEFDLDDHYAALDEVFQSDREPKPSDPAQSTALTAAAPSPSIDSDRSATAGASPKRAGDWVPELEESLLIQVRELAREVAESGIVDTESNIATTADDSTAAPPSLPPHSTRLTPEWDVVQPEWLADREFTPIEIEPHARGNLWVIDDDVAQPTNEPILDETILLTSSAATSAANEAATIELTEGPGTAAADSGVGSDLNAGQEAQIEELLAAAATEDFYSTIRIDPPEARPYSQLFSRLRRLRASVSERLRGSSSR